MRRVMDLEELYHREYGPLVGLLTAISRNRAEAEEVAQDAFVRLIEQWSRVATYDEPAAWLRLVAVRLLLGRRRRAAVARRLLPRLWSSDRPDIASPADARLDLDRAFAQLSPDHRAVVVLHHLCELSVDEVATVLQVRVGTVKSRLARARERLGPFLADTTERDAS